MEKLEAMRTSGRGFTQCKGYTFRTKNEQGTMV